MIRQGSGQNIYNSNMSTLLLANALQVFLLLSFANGLPGPEDSPLERGFSLAISGLSASPPPAQVGLVLG